MSIFKFPVGVLKYMELIRINFFNGGKGSNRKLVWICWNKALASKKKGGLGVSSFFDLNRALIFKIGVAFYLSRDNYYGKQYGKQYYHGEQLNASLMVSGLRCYTPVIGKITVVILVRDRCPRGKGPLRNFFEQRIAAMMGYRGGSPAKERKKETMWPNLCTINEEDILRGVVCTLPTKGMRSIISTVSISLEGFLPSILLLVMIIIAVVIVAVILVVVVVAIVGVVIVVMIIGSLAQNCALVSDPLASGLCWEYAFHQDKASSVRVPVANVTLFSLAQLLLENTHSVRISVGPVFLLGLSAFAMAATCASRAATIPSSGDDVVDLIGDEDPTDEDVDIGVSVSLGDEIFLEGKKSQESNIGDSDNTRDGGKTAGRAIITRGGGIASYACLFFIYRSSCKGEKTSMSKRYLVKSSEDSGETFLGEAGK
ncbi:hypothetical protein Tco_0363413 [Tanacetum coccineum]